MRNLIIVYGLNGDLYWTGETWCADPRLAYRYSAGERNTLELPRGGFWTTVPVSVDMRRELY